MSADLQLAQAVAQGDTRAWNTFIQRYGDLVMSAVVSWCEENCRVPRSQYDSILRTIRAGKPEPAEDPDINKEGIALYKYTMTALRPRLAGYTGQASLGAFVKLMLRDIRRTYMTDERGWLTVPASLAHMPAFEQDVYRLGTRIGSRAVIAARLGVDVSAVAEAEHKVRRAMQAEGKEWWTIGGWAGDPDLKPCDRAEAVAALHERRLSPEDAETVTAHIASCPACAEHLAFLEESDREGGMAPQVAAPVWVTRQVMDEADAVAPEPATTADSWQRKLFSQPDWLLGLAVGAMATAIVLIVLIPRLEYREALKEPGDQLLARASLPLEGAAAKRFAEARAQLAKNQPDQAVQNLKAVLADRPDNQEARWLLATTYDRLGDQIQAAQQYRIFLDTEKRGQAFVDERVKRAQARMEVWEEQP